MNMKFLAGFTFMAAAGSFWACGDGTISGKDESDTITESMYSNLEDLQTMKDLAYTDCKVNDPTCYLLYGAYLEALDNPNPSSPVVTTSSSSTGPYTPPRSSSDDGPIIIRDNSSSSEEPVIIPGLSSSSATVSATGLGSCAPVTNPITKGGSTAWKFSINPNSGIGAAKYQASTASFAWSFGVGANPAMSEKKVTSDAVTYGNSGSYGATLTVTVVDKAETKTETIECANLQVNGDPITGCVCAPVGVTGSVNYETTPDVTWSVTGCVSGSAISSWTWNGTPGMESFTNTFTAAAASYAPTLKVGNSDNTVVDVPCTAVKVTKGEEFTIESTQDKAVFKASGSYAISAKLTEGWHNSDTECNVYCNASTPNFEVEIDGITLSGKASGQTYVSKGGLPVAHTVGGYSIPVTVEIAAGDSVACGVNW